MGRLNSRVSKTLHLRIWIRQIYTLLSSLVRVHLWFGSTDEPDHRLELLLGLCRKELYLSRSVSQFLQAPPLFSVTADSHWLIFADSPAIPVVQDQSKGFCKWPTSSGQGLLVVTSGLSFPLEEPETRGRPLCMVLHWLGGKANAVSM